MKEKKYSKQDVLLIYLTKNMQYVMETDSDYYHDPLTDPPKTAKHILNIAKSYPEFFSKRD